MTEQKNWRPIQLNKYLKDCKCAVINPFDILTAFCWPEQYYFRTTSTWNQTSPIIKYFRLVAKKRLKSQTKPLEIIYWPGRSKTKEQPKQQVTIGWYHGFWRGIIMVRYAGFIWNFSQKSETYWCERQKMLYYVNWTPMGPTDFLFSQILLFWSYSEKCWYKNHLEWSVVYFWADQVGGGWWKTPCIKIGYSEARDERGLQP